MSLAFLLPAGFAALAALLLPLLIHLARRSEQRPTDFAALRWLRQRPKPRHRIRFDERLLLIVRLLLLVLLVLLLARPVLYGSASEAPWVAVVPGVDMQQARETLATSKARQHWLAPGFPALDATPPPPTASITSLLRELDATLPADVRLTVLVPAQLDGADAQRPALSRRVDWRVLPRAMPASPAAPVEAAPALTVRYAADREPALRYLRAANAAWRVQAVPSAGAAKALSIAPHTQALDAQARQLIWLAAGPLPGAVQDWIAEGGVALIDTETSIAKPAPMTALWRDDTGTPLVEGAVLGRGRVMRLTRPLTPQAMPQLLEAEFPKRLRALFSAPAKVPTRVFAAAHAPATGGPVFAQAPRDVQPWLVLLIAALFVLERWLASSPRRGVAP